LSRVLHQPTKPGFHIAELALDYPKRVLDLGPSLRLSPFDASLSFVNQAAFGQRLVAASPRCDLPDNVTVGMFIALYTPV